MSGSFLPVLVGTHTFLIPLDEVISARQIDSGLLAQAVPDDSDEEKVTVIDLRGVVEGVPCTQPFAVTIRAGREVVAVLVEGVQPIRDIPGYVLLPRLIRDLVVPFRGMVLDGQADPVPVLDTADLVARVKGANSHAA
ncbi:MAG: hypothetical protein GYB64_05400 [Chloroflexi bacterium]|nr:hypothetical protein [Chloroflexota bacterium]